MSELQPCAKFCLNSNVIITSVLRYFERENFQRDVVFFVLCVGIYARYRNLRSKVTQLSFLEGCSNGRFSNESHHNFQQVPPSKVQYTPPEVLRLGPQACYPD
jgi:hypothetical protein